MAFYAMSAGWKLGEGESQYGGVVSIMSPATSTEGLFLLDVCPRAFRKSKLMLI